MTSPEFDVITVPKEHHHDRLDVFLAQRLTDFSRALIQTWINEGNVLLNGQVVKPKERLKIGQMITLNLNLLKPREDLEVLTPEDIPLDIIFEDEHLLVVNKPAGMIVHPGAGVFAHTLVNALLFHDTKLHALPRAGIIHRLDKETTGLLIVAKTHESYHHLTLAMKAREIERHYLALVYGEIITSGEVHTFMGRCPKNRLKMAVRPSGREAITHYSIQKKWADLTLLNVKLLTGRTHQIRVHMQHLHHPIVGDPLYGGTQRLPKNLSPEALTIFKGFKRQALHAYALKFEHPILLKELTLQAPLPQDFNTLLNILDTPLERA